MNRLIWTLSVVGSLLAWVQASSTQVPPHADTDELIETQGAPMWLPQLDGTLRLALKHLDALGKIVEVIARQW